MKTMKVTLDYGRTGLTVELPAERLVGPLAIRDVPALGDPEAAVTDALERPVGTPALREIARGRKDACILICDITRPVPNRDILGPMLQVLHEAGIPRDRILILVATGLHRPSTPAEKEEMLGAGSSPELSRRRSLRHPARGAHARRHDPRGIPGWIDSRYVQADLKIATGLIEPHLMAGYSGGRKLICPGVAALETVKRWHGPELLEHPNADCGILEGNPVHEENTAIARMAGCDFIVNVTLDSHRRVTSVVAGDMEQAFLEGVRFMDGVCRAAVPAGRWSRGDQLGRLSAGHDVLPGGQGLDRLPADRQTRGHDHPGRQPDRGPGEPRVHVGLHDHASLDAFMQRILGKDYFVMDQWQVEELAKVRRKAKVKIVSDGLPADVLASCHVEPAPSVGRRLPIASRSMARKPGSR